MASRIVSLSRPQPGPEPQPHRFPGPQLHVPAQPLTRGAGHAPPPRHEWRGASGRSYAHSVYTLLECPPLPAASYILVRRDDEGRRMPLRVGVGTSDAPTLNLAQVRQRGAQAGANEVHVRLGAASDAERNLAACDLRAGLFGTLAAEAGPDSAAEA